MQPENENMRRLIHAPLSDVWQELLGGSLAGARAETNSEVSIPALESDPWSELLQGRGVEMVDLQQLHLHVSDQDVEQVLQIMQEQPTQDVNSQQDADT
jgi:hypothetical protein